VEIFSINLPISLKSGHERTRRCSRSEQPNADLTEQGRTAKPFFDMTNEIILGLVGGLTTRLACARIA
jgi:hypothetical protein